MERMAIPNNMSTNTAAFFIQAAVAFGVSFLAALSGIFFLPSDPWQRLFLGITVLFLVSSAYPVELSWRKHCRTPRAKTRADLRVRAE
jgi:hypothetical protein